MPLGSFTAFTLIGSLVWNTALVVAGYLLAERWERILDVTGPFQNLVVGAIVVTILALIVRQVRNFRRERRAELLTHPDLAHAPLETIVHELEEHIHDAEPSGPDGDADRR